MTSGYRDRDTIARLRAELSSLKAAGTRAEGIEAAAKVADQFADTMGLPDSPAVQLTAETGKSIAEAIRALSPAPEAKPVVDDALHRAAGDWVCP